MGSTGSSAESPESILLHGCQVGNLAAVRRAVDSHPPPTLAELNLGAARAARGKHVQVVRFLLENSASAVAGPLFPEACRARDPDIFQAMYDHGWHAEQINNDMARFPFMQTIVPSRPALTWLLDHGMDPNLPGDRGTSGIRGHMTPLNAAARQGSYSTSAVETLELLLARGAVLDAFVLENAINWREGGKHEPIVLQWLVDHGGDVNFPMRSGANLLHAAVGKRNIKLVTLLLHNGIDASAKDPFNGNTALEKARDMSLNAICKAIEDRGSCMIP